QKPAERGSSAPLTRHGAVRPNLDRFEILDESADQGPGVALGFDVATLLHPELVAPDRHRPRPVCADQRPPIDRLTHLLGRKGAAAALRDPGQIRDRDVQRSCYWTIAARRGSVARRTEPLEQLLAGEILQTEHAL